MFAQNIGWIAGSRKVNKTDEFGGDGFPNVMKRKCVVTFVEFGMWSRRAVDYGFIVTEHVTPSSDQDTKITKYYVDRLLVRHMFSPR